MSQMWIIQKYNVVISSQHQVSSYPLLRRNNNLGSTGTVVVKAANISNSTKKSSGRIKIKLNATKKLSLPSLLRISNITRSVVAVFSLGFIDAGYSGDWSRIGVISAETENFLKAAAFLVVPFCLFLCFNISDQQEQA